MFVNLLPAVCTYEVINFSRHITILIALLLLAVSVNVPRTCNIFKSESPKDSSTRQYFIYYIIFILCTTFYFIATFHKLPVLEFSDLLVPSPF